MCVVIVFKKGVAWLFSFPYLKFDLDKCVYIIKYKHILSSPKLLAPSPPRTHILSFRFVGPLFNSWSAILFGFVFWCLGSKEFLVYYML